jgi:hypothetical protein
MTMKLLWRSGVALCLTCGLMLTNAGCQQRGTTHQAGPDTSKTPDKDKKPDKSGQQPKPEPG